MSDLTTLTLLERLLDGGSKKVRGSDSDLVSLIKLWYKITQAQKKEEEEKKKKKDKEFPKLTLSQAFIIGMPLGLLYLFFISKLLNAIGWHGF